MYCATNFSFVAADVGAILGTKSVSGVVNGKVVHLKSVIVPAISSNDNKDDDEAHTKNLNAIEVEKAVLNGLCRPCHPFLLKYLGFVQFEKICIFVSEFIDGTTFKVWNREEHQAIVRLEVARQISEALKHVHTEGYAHNDISSNNIMIQSHPATEKINAVLIDFGAARAPGKSVFALTLMSCPHVQIFMLMYICRF